MSKVISFCSGKGGVGKTTLVANLGVLLSRSKKTLLVDADWALGKLGLLFGVRTVLTIDKVLSGELSMMEAIVPIRQNLFLISSPSGKLGMEELSEELRIKLFYELENLSHFDWVLLDHSSGLGWGVLQFAAASHQHIIVTTPEPTSYTDAYAIMKILSRRFAIRRFDLVVTMGTHRVSGLVERFCDVVRAQLDVRLETVEIIPWEKELSESIRRQKPYVECFPESAVTSKLNAICKFLDRSEASPRTGLSYFQYSNPMIAR
jgi:flagellar biosynthesis protein FlhG